MLNSEESKTIDEEEMPKKKKTTGKKRIYNPWTKSFYSIRQRSSVKGKRGTIKGKWEPPKKTKKRKR